MAPPGMTTVKQEEQEIDPRWLQENSKRVKYLAEWESGDFRAISRAKKEVLSDSRSMSAAPLSPSFSHLRRWLQKLCRVFGVGIAKLNELRAESELAFSEDEDGSAGKERVHDHLPEDKGAFHDYETVHDLVSLDTLLASFN